ncbi:MAG: MBL fold metallo-hydrolase [Gemmatimonadota bacterium]
MRVTTVGTGTAAPHPSRVQSAVLIEAEGSSLLIDCGSGVVARMASLGLPWQSIRHLAFTHFHSDHCADLPTLVFAWRYGMSPPRRDPVVIAGPPGTGNFLDRFDRVFTIPLRSDELNLDVLELAAHTPQQLGPFTVHTHPVPHTADSIAWSVSASGMRVVVSGDTGFDESFASWATGCDLLILECSLPADLALPIHLTPEECGQVAAIARPGRLALTHFYPPVEVVDVAGIVRRLYPGPVDLAGDGWSVVLGP